MGHDKVVIDLEQHQLLPPARFALTQRVDPAPDRRDPLADVEVEALHTGGIETRVASWLWILLFSPQVLHEWHLRRPQTCIDLSWSDTDLAEFTMQQIRTAIRRRVG